MFLRVSLRHNIIAENKRWMNITFCLPTKYNFLSLFINIWIETHFPLKTPIADFSKIIIQFPCGYVHIMGNRKQFIYYFAIIFQGISQGLDRSSRSQIFFKIGVLKNCTASLLKRDANTGVFLRKLPNFQKQLYADALQNRCS